ncbi:MAG TPA: hypothetical protein VGI99_10650 [Gemmataceae bacterium]
MTSDPLANVVALFCAGFGLFVAAAANVGLRRRSSGLRLGVSLLAIAATAGGALLVRGDAATVGTASAILAAILGLTFVLGSGWLANAAATVAGWLRRPAVRWSLAAALGIATIAGSLLFDDYLMRKDEMEVAGLDPGIGMPKTEVALTAATDRGRGIELRTVVNAPDQLELLTIEGNILKNPTVRNQIILTQPAVGNSNCFGWVFTGGRYWVSGDQVKHIIAENGYQAVEHPQAGDLAIYRSGARILHAAVVRYVADGRPVLVEGKWGCVGVYLHEVKHSIYGTVFDYYRSPRSGHLLAGLDPASPQVPASPASPSTSLMALAGNDIDDDEDDEFIE